MSSSPTYSVLASEGACAQPENREKARLFFGNYQAQVEAATLCASCPVRKLCLDTALDNQEIHGTWGGNTESNLRRVQSLNAEGKVKVLPRATRCPWCDARTQKLEAVIIPATGRHTERKGARCRECGYEFKSRGAYESVLRVQAQDEAKPKLEHGTYSMYTSKGCRCSECRFAGRTYYLLHKARKAGAA